MDQASTSRNSDEPCLICGEPVVEDKVKPGRKAFDTIKRYSIKRGDEVHLKIINSPSELFVHSSCRNSYTKGRFVKNEKRYEDEFSPKRKRTCPKFYFKTLCLLCEKPLGDSRSGSRRLRQAKGDFKTSIFDAAVKRGDRWGRRVVSRVAAEDLEKVKGTYHSACWIAFLKTPKKRLRRGRPNSEGVTAAMAEIFNHMEESDDSQFELNELYELVSDKYDISTITIRRNLEVKYGDKLFIAPSKKGTSICFSRYAKTVVNESWYQERKSNTDEEDLRIVQKAAEIVRKHIDHMKYDDKTYPSAYKFLHDADELIPASLKLFLDVVCHKNQPSDSQQLSTKRKTTTSAHVIISTIRPRTFRSPILLSIGSYIHQNLASKGLITLLSNLGLCSSYHNVKTLESSMIQAPEAKIAQGAFLQFAFDNCDFNVNTIDGFGTFHNMAGIKIITPMDSIVNSDTRVLVKKRMTTAEAVQRKGLAEVVPLDFKQMSGLQNFQMPDLNELVPVEKAESHADTHNVLWMFAKFMKMAKIPGWQGFLEKITSTGYGEVSSIITLPFIMAPPSNVDTVHTALMMAVNHTKSVGLNRAIVTFDLPLFMRAVDITMSAPPGSPLKSVTVRLGGFHMIMSFLGSIGKIMSGSGLEQLMAIVYAENTVKHIFTGHAYARAVRAHNLVSTALFNLILENIELTDAAKEGMEGLLKEFDSMPPSKDEILGNVDAANYAAKVAEEMIRLKNVGPTPKLWIQYLEMVTLMRKFLEAERTSNWEKHLKVVKLMIPYFIASGHLHYSKACYIYLHNMCSLKHVMSGPEYERFTTGRFTVRRSNKFCSGTSPDMCIEQTTNREFKVSGGIVQRGFTHNILSQYVLSKPALNLITSGLEDFANISYYSSEQHVDARDSRMARDVADVAKMQEWLTAHDPFNNTNSVLESLGTGIKADDTINCHMSREVGEIIMTELVGMQFSDVTLKRSKNVRPLSALTTSLKVNEKVVTIDPLLIFQRMLIWKQPTDNLSDYFRHELAPYPMSLFTDTGMRKNTKSSLYDEFETVSPAELKNSEAYVFDGGYLLHAVKWNKQTAATYGDVCERYVSYVMSFTENRKVVVFDGYDDPNSTKKSEQARRYQTSTPQFNITRATPVRIQQEKFLANVENKKQLISMLSSALKDKDVEVKQAKGDADVLIVKTALQLAEHTIPTIVSQDVDIIVIMIACADPDHPILMLKPKIGKTQQKVFSSNQQQHAEIKHYILLAHSFSGCDTTSAIFGKGKKLLLSMFKTNPALIRHATLFNSTGSSKQEIAETGELLFLNIYGASEDLSIDEHRYALFKQSIKKRMAAKLEALPPTSNSAAHHAWRSYHQVQKWLGNDLSPEEWGWIRNKYNDLRPIPMTLLPAPDTILAQIFCGCKGNCATAQCTCRKSSLTCTTACKNCEGLTCENATMEEQLISPEESEDENDDCS